jgi:hypothetical protein
MMLAAQLHRGQHRGYIIASFLREKPEIAEQEET